MSEFVRYARPRFSAGETRTRGERFFELMNERRSVRDFSSEPVPRELIETAIRTAGTAPSGAHLQPWRFVAVSDREIKRAIREAAEKEEYESYEGGRMPDVWKRELEKLGTTWRKPYLELVPWIVVAFEQTHRVGEDGTPVKNYYVKESVGLACGLFIACLHSMGLATLTHTPSPMGFLRDLLGRPSNEKPFILFPVGYPAADAQVPALTRKPLDEIAIWNPGASDDAT
jgi:nitroreductase